MVSEDSCFGRDDVARPPFVCWALERPSLACRTSPAHGPLASLKARPALEQCCCKWPLPLAGASHGGARGALSSPRDPITRLAFNFSLAATAAPCALRFAAAAALLTAPAAAALVSLPLKCTLLVTVLHLFMTGQLITSPVLSHIRVQAGVVRCRDAEADQQPCPGALAGILLHVDLTVPVIRQGNFCH